MYIPDSVPYYDKLYEAQGKDYRGEAAYVRDVIRSRRGTRKTSLLDVGCGTGGHLVYLRKDFDVEGVDVGLEFVKVARAKVPRTKIYVGDMRTFSIGKEYDVVTCLFSSIGYMDTYGKLVSALRNMARHVRAGGVMLIEPWFSPGQIANGRVSVTSVDEEKLKVVRMSTTKVEGAISSFDFHYLVGTPQGTTHFVEKHRLGMFTREEMTGAFEKCRLSVEFDKVGPTGRGMYIGQKS